jgi:P-type Ca2+ transporter type 2B
VSDGILGTVEDIAERAERYGTNRKIPKKTKKVCEMIKESFEDTILRILCVAAVVSLVIGIVQDGWLLGSADGGSIILAIIIIVSVTVGNNLVKER